MNTTSKFSAISLNNAANNSLNINFDGCMSFTGRLKFINAQIKSNKENCTKEFIHTLHENIAYSIDNSIKILKNMMQDSDIWSTEEYVHEANRTILKLEHAMKEISSIIDVMNPDLEDTGILKYTLRSIDIDYIKGYTLDELDLEDDDFNFSNF